jgi:hypothetical protein
MQSGISSGGGGGLIATPVRRRPGPGPEQRLVRPVRRQALAEPTTAHRAELRRVHVALDAEHGRAVCGHAGGGGGGGVVDGGPFVLVVERWAG